MKCDVVVFLFSAAAAAAAVCATHEDVKSNGAKSELKWKEESMATNAGAGLAIEWFSPFSTRFDQGESRETFAPKCTNTNRTVHSRLEFHLLIIVFAVCATCTLYAVWCVH